MKKLLKAQKGFAHHLIIVGLVVLLAVGGAGYYAWKRSSNTGKVSAESPSSYQWTPVLSRDPLFVYVCKTDIGGDYWKIRAYAKNNTVDKKPWKVVSVRGGTFSSRIVGGDLSPKAQSNVHYATVKKSEIKELAGGFFTTSNNSGSSIGYKKISEITSCEAR